MGSFLKRISLDFTIMSNTTQFDPAPAISQRVRRKILLQWHTTRHKAKLQLQISFYEGFEPIAVGGIET